MNRNEAKILAEIVSNEDLKQMFINARNGIKNWESPATVNKGMTKGAAFNILSKCGVETISGLGKINCIHEFGDWLPNYDKPNKIEKQKVKPFHQEPARLDDFFKDIID